MPDHYSKVLEEIRTRCWIEKLPPFQTAYRARRDGFLYLRFSRRAARQNKYFFGVPQQAIDMFGDSVYNIILVCGTIGDGAGEGKALVLPSEAFGLLTRGIPTKGGQWKLNVFLRDGRFEGKVAGRHSVDLSAFADNWDVLCAKVIAASWPLVESDKDSASSLVAESGPLAQPQDAPSAVARRLLETSQISAVTGGVYRDFEFAVKEAFEAMGFKAKHLGSAGDTDVLLEEPFSAVVDTKATSRTRTQSVNFTRIEQHKLLNKAHYKMVISRGFQPADIADAQMTKTTLLNVVHLIQLLESCQQLLLSPEDLTPVFERHGLVSDEDIAAVCAIDEQLRADVQTLPALLDAITPAPKGLLEIIGAYRARCEMSSLRPLGREGVASLVDFLANPPIRIIERNEAGEFYRTRSVAACLNRLTRFGQVLPEAASATALG